ncbi:uncharacterized protein ColSpa_09788 [Colletotrichum spaethianum]|uniref:Uncharacterized protein n=1 Tax=Colletotrichum spaethianum TaxID=700344 RepID=A0AA37UQW6_9PEZI|nr:uncharacterized protein ColSpa_09788 [Colletotrichum spaethianum]GKT49607.1 hypothetical protein ColSpa_09788 [Colletotrichum spaethianum]
MASSSALNRVHMNAEAPAQCMYAAKGLCRVWGLANCLRVISDESLHLDQRLERAELLREALTMGPRFVSVSHVCCGNNTLLSLAVGMSCSVETLQFLLSHARFRQEDGCRITDFVEHLGSVMVLLMANSRARCFENRLPGDGKKCLRVLLRAGSQNSFVKNFWYDNGKIHNWLLSIFNAASTREFTYHDDEVPEHPQSQHLVPIPALLDFVECIIELFYDKDSPCKISDNTFWTAILKSLWTHAHVTRGTLTRVADVTLRLLELGVSKQIDLPGAAKGGSFLTCVESGLFPNDVIDPDLDDVDAIIGDQVIRGTNELGQNFVLATDMLWETRKANIERLQKHILGGVNPPVESLGAAVKAAQEEIQAQINDSLGDNSASSGSTNGPGGPKQAATEASFNDPEDWDLFDDIKPQ